MYNRTFQHLQKSPLTSFELAIYSSINVTIQPGIFDPFKSLFSFTFDSEFDISKVKVDSSGSNLGAISPNLPLPNNKLTANALMHINNYNATLQFLQIIRTYIVIIEDESFSVFSKLQRLMINNAILQHVSQHAFSGLYHLEELYLTNNQLTEFPGLALSEISIRRFLRVLDLSHNKLTSANTHYPLPSSFRVVEWVALIRFLFGMWHY